MAIDIYAPCPCGSGKKFKWCCQPLYQELDKAYAQEDQGQHDSALRILDEIVAKHSDNPEAWGRKAHLLFQLGKLEDSENALQKSLELNPNYPFGHLLKGMMRQAEGEMQGALMLYRRAAALYDLEARDILAQIYALIAECESYLHRPVAARAALKIAIHNAPAQEELRGALDRFFGDQAPLPKVARQDYTLLPPQQADGGTVPPAWERALTARENLRLSDLATIFDELTRERPGDAAAWYNLALAHAWLGENPRAVEALDRYVSLESSEDRAIAAWALAEALRCGRGMEEQTDHLENWVVLQIQDGNQVVPLLEQLGKEQRLLLFKTEQQSTIVGLVTEKPALLTGTPAHASPLQAHIAVGQGVVQLWHVNADAVTRLRQELQLLHPGAFAPNQHEFKIAAAFSEILSEAVVFPVGNISDDELTKRLLERMEYFFEDVWVQRSLIALEHQTPINAATDRKLQKKVKGVISFLEDCAVMVRARYDFDRLRRKLGFLEAAPTGTGGTRDVSSMAASELAALKPADLPDDQLEQAYRAAQKLDADELAENFADNLVSRNVTAKPTDRGPVYFYLIQKALQDGRLDDALDRVEEGERFDCENNEGRRRNEFELRRGQVLVRRKEANQAWDVFQRLIERAPSDMRVRAAATEGMLSLRDGGRALQFAEQGLAKARELNDGESEGHFLELLQAAKKIAGQSFG
jgi:tetratricopeptide (TPR) repeat protein